MSVTAASSSPAVTGGGAIVAQEEVIPFFDALLLTASNPSQAAAFALEVRLRQSRGSLPPPEKCKVLVVCDPLGQRIGSGGATLAALEALRAAMPGETRQEQVAQLLKLKIGMFHSGGDSQRLPTCSVRGKAFCGLPCAPPSDSSAAQGGVFEATPLDFLLTRLANLQRCPGVIVSATDCLLDFPEDYPPICGGTPESEAIIGCSVRTPRKLGSAHGVFVVDQQAFSAAGQSADIACGMFPVADILQKASQSTLESAGAVDPASQTVLLDAGNIFLPPRAIEALLALATQAPFDSCCQVPLAAAAAAAASSTTSNGGSAIAALLPATLVKAFRFELYTDMLLPSNPRCSFESYLASEAPEKGMDASVLSKARTMLWTALHPFPAFVAVHPHAAFFHMGTMPERMDFMFAQTKTSSNDATGAHSNAATIAALRRDTHFTLQAQTAFDDPTVARRSQGAATLNALFQTRADDEYDEEDDAKGSDGAVVAIPAGAEDDDDRVVGLSTGSFVEYAHLRGRFFLSPGAMVSGVRSRALATNLRVPQGIVVQETLMAREEWAPLLLGRRAAEDDDSSPPPTVVSLFHSHDSIKTPYNAPDGKATFLGMPFEPLLSALVDASDGAFDLPRLVRALWPDATSDAQRTLWSARMFPLFQAREDLLPSEPGQEEALPCFYPYETDTRQLSLWMLRLRWDKNGGSVGSAGRLTGLPPAHVLSTWFAAPRASFRDVLACADGQGENLWRERLAARVDQLALKQELHRLVSTSASKPSSSIGSSSTSSNGAGASAAIHALKSPPLLMQGLLARAAASHLHYPREGLAQALLHSLDQWSLRGVRRRDRLDVAMRCCWVQAQLVGLLFAGNPENKSEPVDLEGSALDTALQSQPLLASVRAQVARVDASNFETVLPWALAKLSLARKELFSFRASATVASSSSSASSSVPSPSVAVLRSLYGLVSAACSRVGVASRASDIVYIPRATAVEAPVRVGQVVVSEGSLRIDMSGGWTDTPPICFERAGNGSNSGGDDDGGFGDENAGGGAVVNVAVSVPAGQLPLKVRAAVTLVPILAESGSSNSAPPPPSPPCIIVDFAEPPLDGVAASAAHHVELTSLAQMSDYASPAAPAALLKCVLLAMGLVRLPPPSPSEKYAGASVPSPVVPTLSEQLSRGFWSNKPRDSIGYGEAVQLRVRSWLALSAEVCQGTGLGVSSILAAHLVLVLARLFDRVYSSVAVTHLVLLAEQLLTSAGGWQDQVGALWPGVKLARSEPGLPLRLSVKSVPLSAEASAQFSARLLLVHTGLPRLARHLLRTVLDHWARRTPEIVACFDELHRGALHMARAIAAQDWPRVGQLLSQYWSLKRRLATPPSAVEGAAATPAEPAHVSAFLARLSEHKLVHGASLVGAGGGGFLVLLAEPERHDAIRQQVDLFNQEQQQQQQHSAPTRYQVYTAAVCHAEGQQRRLWVEESAAFV
jgi:fucokinase